ncbi:hypothetical protein SLS59_001553 [Nothophoma quercina]|uniref:Uncharacterized protein n=1 Tax=Nothophoma quercina TaxID=749835 RepID=A0ABR3RXM3_9PLEO
MGGNRAANQFQKKHGEQVNDDCLGKFCWQEAGLTSGIYCHEANCDHTFAEWLTGQRRWRERLEIHRTGDTGYGLYSKANPAVPMQFNELGHNPIRTQIYGKGKSGERGYIGRSRWIRHDSVLNEDSDFEMEMG